MRRPDDIEKAPTVEMRIGAKENNPRFWDVTGAYAQEAIERAKMVLELGVDGDPVPSPG
jgi:hypothetical protein